MLELPISPRDALDQIIRPGIGLLPRPAWNSEAAQLLLLAIALQESGLARREQVGGPARGLWQFELGGVQAVLEHPDSAVAARALSEARTGTLDAASIQSRLADDDLLAAGLARLLLWTDPLPLPAPGRLSEAWAYYLRNWRPGRPAPGRWTGAYRDAFAVMKLPASEG